jgi:hypothetical protein
LESATQPLWGHALHIWDTGKVIRVPQYVFPILRQMGLLIKNKPVLSPLVQTYFDDPRLHPLTHELVTVLGRDFSGPAQVKCKCSECRERVNLDDSRVSDQHTRQIVNDVKSRRKIAA